MKTHQSITNKDLRTMMALELLALRNAKKRMKAMDIIPEKEFFYGYVFGLDTAYIRMQYYLDTGKVPELRILQ